MASLFRFFNPCYLFRDRTFDFIEQHSNFLIIIMRPEKGIAERVMRRSLKKIFGKDFNYIRSPFKEAIEGPREFNENFISSLIQNSWWDQWTIRGKGVPHLLKLNNNKNAQGRITSLSGFVIEIISVNGKDYNWIHSLVYKSIVTYRDVTGVILKELPHQCPYCHALLTNHVDAKPEVTTVAELIAKRAEALAKDMEGEDLDDIEWSKHVDDTHAELDSYGDCNNCDGTILDLSDKQLLKLFKDIFKAQKETGYKLFSDFY